MSRLITLFAFLLVTTCIHANHGYISPQKTILITVDAGGHAYVGRDTLAIDKLAEELQQRLWKSYLSTGKMYDDIKLEWRGEVLMGVRGSAMDAIHKAQQDVIREVCLEKHKKLFEDLSQRQKDKLKRQFPILFQERYD